MPHNLERVTSLDVKRFFTNHVEVTATATELNTLSGVTAVVADINLVAGMAAGSRGIKKVAKVALAAVDTGGGIFSWQNPEIGAIIVNRVTIVTSVVATGACSISIGSTATSGTTSSANLIDTLDVHTATVTTDNLQTPGANGKQLQSLAAGKWVTGSKASGASAGLVGFVYIEYSLQ